MTNINIQSPLPLQGPGFVRKLNGGYDPGEMKKLVNCEFLEDTIVTRRQAVGGTSNIVKPSHLTNAIHGVKGVVTPTGIEFHNSGGSLQGTVGSTVPAIANYTTSLEDVVEYRDQTFVVALEHPTVNGTARKLVVYKVTTANRYEPNLSTGATKTTVASLSVDANVSSNDTWEAHANSIRGCFVHKERLFIAAEDTLYWSKATDPSVWTVPDGGFIKFDMPGNITDIVAVNDTIYVCSNDKIVTLSYSVDIDTELVVRTLNAPFGGYSMTVYQNSVYIVNSSGIYRLQNANIEKLIELPFKWTATGGLGEAIKIVGHDEYMYILPYSFTTYSTLGPIATTPFAYMGRFVDYPSAPVPPPMYAFNMETGCMFEYRVNYPNPSQNYSFVVDISTFTDGNGNNNLAFLVNDWTSTALNIINATGQLIHTNSRQERLPHEFSYRMPIDIEFDSFCPDGNEHLMKKFRMLLVEGTFPGGASDSLKCAVAYDNKTYKAPINFEDANVATARPPYPHRMGLNQRARSVSVNIYNSDLGTVLGGGNPIADQKFEIDDIRLLWTYTQRVLDTAEQSKTA